MIIPARFKIFNQTIKVIYKRDLQDKHDAVGMWVHAKNTIYLQQSTRKYIYSKEQIEQAFLHEVVHCILTLLSYHNLSRNEALVDRLGMVLHQIIEQIEDGARQ